MTIPSTPDLFDPKTIERILAEHNLSALHQLGQNFLIDRSVAEEALAAAEIVPEDILVEVGPGMGNWTSLLAATGARVFAYEIDRGFVAWLGELFAGNDRVHILHGDIFTADMRPVQALHGRKKLVANLPYERAVAIVLRLMMELTIERAVVLVPLDIAKKIIAPAGGATRLSLTFAPYMTGRIIREVSHTSFFPKPKITSALLLLQAQEQPLVPLADFALWDRFVASLFHMPRKRIINNLLAAAVNTYRAAWETVLAELDISIDARPQSLSFVQAQALYEVWKSKK